MEDLATEAIRLKRAEIQIRRASILGSVKKLISEGDFEGARAIARKELDDTPEWKEVARAFEAAKPLFVRCESGHEVTDFSVMPFTLAWSFDCPECAKLKLWGEDRRKRERIDAFKAHVRGRIQDILRKCGVPKRYLSARLEDFKPELRSRAGSVFLTGLRGVGKTHYAVALLRDYLLNAEPRGHVKNPFYGHGFGLPDAAFITAPELLLAIRDSFRDNSERTEKEIIDQYADSDCLILDDLGAEKTSKYSLQTLYTLLDRRYREERQTVITSDLSLDALAKKLDDRIASRIAGLCKVLTLRGLDKRVIKYPKGGRG